MRIHRDRPLSLMMGLAGAALLGAFALSSCVVAAVGVTAVVASQEFMDNSTIAYVKVDEDMAWEQTKATMQRLSLDEIEIDENARAAQANIDGARVTAHVQTSGVNQAKIAVGARKWTLYDEDIARSVLERIKEGL